MKSSNIKASILGSMDGYNTAAALILGSHHLGLHLPLTISLGGALSMGAGEFVSAMNDKTRSARSEVPASLSMTAATFIGSFLPCVPVILLNNVLGIVLAIVLGLALAGIIGHLNGGKRSDYLTVYSVFLFVLIPTALLGTA